METTVYRQGTDLFIEVAIKDQTIYLETLCQEVRVPDGKIILLRSYCDPALYQEDRRGEFLEPKYSLTALLEGAEEPLSPLYKRKPDCKKEGIIGIELEEAISEKTWRAYRQQFRDAMEQDVVCWVREIIEANYHYENIYEGDDNNMWELLDKDYEYWSDYFRKEMVEELCDENIRDGWINPGDEQRYI